MTKNYIQPEVQVAHWTTMSLMQAASPAPANAMDVHTIPTNDQW